MNILLVPTRSLTHLPSRPHVRGATLGALSVALLLGGCQVDQKKEVAEYRKLLDAAVAPPSTQPAGPLTLEHALRAANQVNEHLGVVGEDYLQALILKNRATAAFLPTVQFQPSWTVEQRPRNNAGAVSTLTTTGGDSATFRAAPANVTTVSTGYRPLGSSALQKFEAPVTGQMNLFRGFGDVANLRVANATIAQRKQELLNAQATVLVDVAQVYYQVLRSEQVRDVLRNSINLQEARVHDEEQKLANGLSTNLAVAQVRAQLDATRATLAQTEGDVINGRTTLGYLIGEPTDTVMLTSEIYVPDIRPAVTEFERLSLERRQDLLAARAQVTAARAQVDVAVSQYYPSVNLNVEGFLYREYYADASKWSAILSANIPIFSAGLIEQDVRAAWSRYRQALLIESDTRRSIVRDVQMSYQNLLTAERRIVELQSGLAAADEALKQAQSALANNLGIVLDVLTAQDQQLNSQLQLTSAQFDRSVYYLDLLRTTGELPLHLPTRTVATTVNSTQP
ncbi:hypothetical protein BH10PLA1_BH10PLA1_14050 [soil metagenome]